MRKLDKPTVFRAIREKIANEYHDDPAPWLDGGALVELWGGTEQQHKLDAATKTAFLGGLLNGKLVAVAEIRGEWLAVPGWYWSRASRETLWSSWPERLPAEWVEWRSIRPEWFAAESVDDFVASFSWNGSAELPPAYDEPTRPEAEFRRPLPDTGMVTLSEAVSWAAWRFALNGSQLCNALDHDEFGAGGLDQVRQSCAELLAHAKAKRLQLVGRSKDRRSAASDTCEILAHQLLDYGRFNPVAEALERGSGLAIDDEPLDRVLSDDARSFVDVHVARADVLALYPDHYLAACLPPGPDDWLKWNEALAWLMWQDGEELGRARLFDWRGDPDQAAAALFALHFRAETQPPPVPYGNAKVELFELLRSGTAKAEGRATPLSPHEPIPTSHWRDAGVGYAQGGFSLGHQKAAGNPWFYDLRICFGSPQTRSDVAPIDPAAPPAINRDKELADKMASIVRERGGKISVVMREVMPDATGGRELESCHTALRKSFNYYYDRSGRRKF